jgi:hypothetical protein
VVYREGELSKGTIDREWPHQVALRADFVAGRNFPIIHEFCRPLSLCPRGHFFYRPADGTHGSNSPVVASSRS